ncbi:hypothetical protein UCRNP2_6132 [Neofusicoccum parvum UCRNP2]|uniref:Uncharacterized protein n=1 Tax=Botryosphaeria parva (strain UCR-NP2) TaxID=1287680 RepID=R1GFS5_BOTPV|nr:hypothetical protein UCRNP2_6132 [Neofusicoccum parvum UCRNP2]
MNRFLTRKKTEAALDGSDAPPPSTKKSKKGKKAKEEPKPELDLAQALPSSDNFRTSLLMPNLSARFSMLREQDDPQSKLGKASDDSVLYPKRQSRLTDFGFNATGLQDIAEVSSINGSIRPPFLAGRADSIDGGYGTDDDSIHSGSVMSRSRPGEGNVLFGGRQKVYLGNRALYDDDVGMSAYQKRLYEQGLDRNIHEQNSAPGDRGKATAMGAFNKPAHQFDETQYMQRQKQMLQGRETPPLRKPSRSPSRAVQEKLDKFEMKRRESDAKYKQPPSKNVSDARKRLDALRTGVTADTCTASQASFSAEASSCASLTTKRASSSDGL